MKGTKDEVLSLSTDKYPLSISDFGKLIKMLRNKKGLTLMELSNLTGYSNPYLSQIETGKKKTYPTPELLEKLSSHLGVEYFLLLEAAGYSDLAQGVKYRRVSEDFSNLDKKFSIEEMKRLQEEVKIAEHITDIKRFLEEDISTSYEGDDQGSLISISPTYNGHRLTYEERKRIVEMIELMFPHFKDPYRLKRTKRDNSN